MNPRRSILALSTLLSTAMAAGAQTQSFIPIVLTLPSGPRSLALGNIGVTSRDDEVLFFNPAQLVVASGFSASAERYDDNSNGLAMSAVTRFNGGGVAIGVRTNNIDQPVVIGAGTPLAFQETAVSTSLEASVGFAQVVKGLRIGAAAKYAEQDLGIERAQQGLLDLGVAKQMFGSYTVGAAVQNLGKDPDLSGPVDVVLPRAATLGVSRAGSVGEFDLLGTAAVSWRRDNALYPAGGLEVNYSWLSGYNIAIRAGARRPEPNEKALTGGAGFTMDRLSIDYAFEQLRGKQFGHRIGLRVR